MLFLVLCVCVMCEKIVEDVLDIVISCVVCECVYDGDECVVVCRFGMLE